MDERICLLATQENLVSNKVQSQVNLKEFSTFAAFVVEHVNETCNVILIILVIIQPTNVKGTLLVDELQAVQ